MNEVEVRAVGPDQLDALRVLFESRRNTRHCWCTAFCTSSWSFAAGWYGGGNRRRFATMAAAGPQPMGVLATVADEPAGWCACGPRSRYTAAISGRSRLLATRPRAEDEDVWLIACVVTALRHRGLGLTLPLLRAAVALARDQGAVAVEAWPLATGVRRPGEEHVGGEAMFARLGFRPVERPSAERVLLRLDLTGPPA